MTKRNYPYIALDDAVAIISKARKGGRIITKEFLASVGASRIDAKSSTKSGAFTRKIGALNQYGFITADSPGKIKLSDRAEKIVYTTSEDEKIQNLRDAFNEVETFKELYQRITDSDYDRQLLRNLSIREIGISEQGADKFLNNFIESAISAKLLDYANETKTKVSKQSTSADLTDQQAENMAVDESQLNGGGNKLQASHRTIEFPTKSGQIKITFPNTLDIQEKEIIKSLIDMIPSLET